MPGSSSPWAPSDEGAVAAATEGEKTAVNRKLSIVVTVLSLRASPTSLIRGRLWAAATEGEKAAGNRKLSIIVTVLSLRASPTSLVISARRRYASEQPTKSALSESQREALNRQRP